MAKFYRVEKDGKGPYCNDNSVIVYLTEKGVLNGELSNDYMRSRPLPPEDGLNDFTGDYVFGFAKFDDIFNWFNLKEEHEFFRKNGFSIVIYETCDIMKGRKQAIANKNSLEFAESIAF